MTSWRCFTIALCSGTMAALTAMGHTEVLLAYGLILAWELLAARHECVEAEA